ncbi:MAG TPA: hypothetical protein PLS69_11835, partial [Terricaulis sp.]|nr:hypothetical protein [Terricaulis sp.]
MLRDRVSDHFLLRRAHANEGETRRLPRREGGRVGHRERIVLQPHRRLMPAHVGEPIAAAQRADRHSVAANNRDRLIGIDHLIEQALGQVSARGARQFEAGAFGQARQDGAIVQRQPRISVKRAAARLGIEANDVIDVWRSDISKRPIDAPARGHGVHRRIKIARTERKAQKVNRA